MGSCSQAVRLILVLVLSFVGVSVSAGECRDNEVFLRGAWGQARFSVELAQTRAERNQGLMHRESMPKSAGMLFVYERPGSRSFWMKNTLIPLDMLFFNESGVIESIHHQARPHDLSPHFGGHNIQYVLEINGGMAKALGITEGSEMRHPAIGAEIAAWPC